jgi:hypothetical protein
MPPEKTYNEYPTPHPVQVIPIDELPFVGVGGRRDISVADGDNRPGSERSVDKPGSNGFPALSSQNSHNSGQSPTSLDMSENSQNSSTSPSQSNPPSSSPYPRPSFFTEYGSISIGIDGMDSMNYSQLPKDMDWSMLANFDGPDLDSEMTAMGGLNGMIAHTEMNDFFAESST